MLIGQIMIIQFQNTGKCYDDQWVFRHLNLEMAGGERLAVLGGNGSGKSTLLRLFSGAVMPSEGKVLHLQHERPLTPDQLYPQLAMAAPWCELISAFSVDEMVHGYFRLKSLQQGVTIPMILEQAGLQDVRMKRISVCSSGMKQRLKLALALYCDTPLLLLDEPLTNLDQAGMDWYQQVISAQPAHRTLVICSNYMRAEYEVCRREHVLA